MFADFFRFLSITFAVVAALSANDSAAVAADPPTKEQLDELLKEYKLYELPMPPKDAPLVRYSHGVREYRRDGTWERNYCLGFLLMPVKDAEPATLWFNSGLIGKLDRSEQIKPIAAVPASLEEINTHLDLQFAIYFYGRGWTELAVKVLEANVGKERPTFASELAQIALNYWQSKILEPASDRKKIAEQLKLIAKLRPEEFGAEQKRFLDALELSMVPGKGKPGTIEAMIDTLIDVTETHRTASRNRAIHPSYLKIALLGMDAIPSLLLHQDDERMARTRRYALNGRPGPYYRIADVVGDILQGFAGDDLGEAWDPIKQAYRVSPNGVEKWWAEAKKAGEEAYFLEHVLPKDIKSRYPNRLILEVLAEKYPKHIPETYRRMLKDRPDMYGSDIAKAVAASSLSKETKRDLFILGAGAKSLTNRRDAIILLRELDPKEATRVLVATVKAIPEMQTDPSVRSYLEGQLAAMVIESNEPKVWEALEVTARRSTVAFRAELLSRMAEHNPKQARTERLRFAVQFLDDVQVWKTATRTAAAILQMRQPNSEWTRMDWEDLLDDVRTSAAFELKR